VIDGGIGQPWPREVLDAVARFKQGDLIERPPLFYAAVARHGVWSLTRAAGDPAAESDLLEVDPADGPPYGLIITQTCDLSEQSPRPRQPWLMVAPVYRADAILDRSQQAQVERWQVGHLARLAPPSLPPGFWVVDLRIEMPLEKSWLVGREPIAAYPAEEPYLKLARHLALRRQRPALADALVSGIVQPLRASVRTINRTRRADVIDSVRELRLAIDGTRLAPTAARLLVITHGEPPPAVVAWFDGWWDGARSLCASQGVQLMRNSYGALADLSAADYADAVPLDFAYLSPDD
jgi:hypothetical protein